MAFRHFWPGLGNADASGSRVAPTRIDLQHAERNDLAACANQIGSFSAIAGTREQTADRIVQHLFESLVIGKTNDPACALVRCFGTFPLSQLPRARREFAVRQLGSLPRREDMRCLTLLATRGLEPQWNSVDQSAGHQAIPLPSVEVILKAPMIARLLLQLGVRYEHVIAPPEGESLMLEGRGTSLNMFHVARAPGSKYIPAQASFVHRFGIRSVLGFGGMSPAGEVFATMLFTRVPVSRAVAEQFGDVAEAVREALLRFPSEQTFAAVA